MSLKITSLDLTRLVFIRANAHRFFQKYEKSNNYLTEKALCDIMYPIMFEQEAVTEKPGIRELSYGARQLFGFGEFILLVAGLKSGLLSR